MEVKTIQDYYEQIQALYPTIKKSDLLRILMYGWKLFAAHNSYGGDVLIQRKGFWGYCGSLRKDSIKYLNYYKAKLAVKLRIMFNKLKINWNGYYYFALTRSLYETYLSLKNKRGRPKKIFKFENVKLYKIYDECSIMEHGKVALFKIPWVLDMGFHHFKYELITDKAEFILERNPLQFKDILTSNYKFEFL